jgi:hypothetical protein
MIKTIFKTIAIGVLVGLLFFVAFRVIVVFAILGLIFKLSGKGKWKREHWRNRKLAFVDRIRTMEDDEFENFKSNYGQNHCHHYYSESKPTAS